MCKWHDSPEGPTDDDVPFDGDAQGAVDRPRLGHEPQSVDRGRDEREDVGVIKRENAVLTESIDGRKAAKEIFMDSSSNVSIYL